MNTNKRVNLITLKLLAITSFLTLSGLWVCAFVQDANAQSTAPGQLQTLSNQVPALAIIPDNSREDWGLTTPYISDTGGDNSNTGQIDWRTITMAHDCDELFVRFELDDGPAFQEEGYRYNLLVDVDRNPMTGYRGLDKRFAIGADVLIQGGPGKITTFKFTASDNQAAWNWQQVNSYPLSELPKTPGGRDVVYRINSADLDVFNTGVAGFDWVAWADYSNGLQDLYPDTGNQGDAGGYNTYTFSYAPTNNIINPERGFYETTQTQSGNYTPLNLSTLQCYRQNEGISLIHRFFYLENFINSDISQQYLSMMQADFDTIRQAGLKVIPRFAYSASAGPNLTPPYNDAPKERILSHLDQTAGVLKKNADVIAVMQAGFIGLWGEWWYSDHFQPDSAWNDRTDVLYKILDSLPSTRSVQIRTPRYKQNIFNVVTPIDKTTAHNGSDLARTGHHNDCFVSSSSDGGTYVSPSSEYPYLQEETLWLPVGGETCAPEYFSDPDPGRLSCASALDELGRLHWSFLNLDWYQPTLKKWLNNQCFSEIEQRLGYHFVFLQGDYDKRIKRGQPFRFSLQLKNDGFSAPINPRLVELILRHSDGSTHSFSVADDPRFWLAGQSHTVAGEIVVPANFPAGQYELLLNLPDPEPTLHTRPEYSIRLANDAMWEVTTGYNKLNQSVSVEPQVYYPHAIKIMQGRYAWGSLASFKTADNDTYDIKAGSYADGKSTDWYAMTTVAENPGELTALFFNYKGQYSIKNILQSVYLYNYQTAQWDLQDKQMVGNTDDVTVSAVINTNPGRYVSLNGVIKLRVDGFHPSRNFTSWSNELSWSVK